MQMFYGALALVMAFRNFMKGLNTGSPMHFLMAAMWLAIGVVFTAKHIKDKKKADKRKQKQNKEV